MFKFVIGSLFVFSLAHAYEEMDDFTGLYLEAGYSLTRVDYGAFGSNALLESSFPAGASVAIGYNITEHVAAQLGYSATQERVRNAGNARNRTKFSEFSIDFKGRYPIYDKTRVIGALGYSKMRANNRLTINGQFSEIDNTADNIRISGGFERDLTDNLYLKTEARYSIPSFGGVDSLTQLELGIGYNF